MTVRFHEQHCQPGWSREGTSIHIDSLFKAWRRQRNLWRERRHYRQDLRRLLRVGGHILDDIGLPRREAEREAAKPFWRA